MRPRSPIHHLDLNVSNLEVSAAFYDRVLTWSDGRNLSPLVNQQRLHNRLKLKSLNPPRTLIAFPPNGRHYLRAPFRSLQAIVKCA